MPGLAERHRTACRKRVFYEHHIQTPVVKDVASCIHSGELRVPDRYEVHVGVVAFAAHIRPTWGSHRDAVDRHGVVRALRNEVLTVRIGPDVDVGTTRIE